MDTYRAILLYWLDTCIIAGFVDWGRNPKIVIFGGKSPRPLAAAVRRPLCLHALDTACVSPPLPRAHALEKSRAVAAAASVAAAAAAATAVAAAGAAAAAAAAGEQPQLWGCPPSGPRRRAAGAQGRAEAGMEAAQRQQRHPVWRATSRDDWAAAARRFPCCQGVQLSLSAQSTWSWCALQHLLVLAPWHQRRT